MAQEHRTQFDTYRVRYQTGGGVTPEVDCFHQRKLVGTLLFHPDEVATPQNDVLPAADGAVLLRLHFTISQFPHLIDLLREEKPLYLSFSESTHVGAVMTGQEPVGEGEPYLSR
jgi:hypothetical protein